MSSYQLKAKNKLTQKIESFTALDDYFGKHEFGYLSESGSYTEQEFNRLFERVK